MMYQVNDIYRTIQGEGWNSGLPCTLVRLQGCNLHCSFCDTQQAQDAGSPAVFFSMGLMDLCTVIEETHKAGDIILITGGEPTLQDLGPLTSSLAPLGPVHIETNGTGEINAKGVSWVTVSPKLDAPGELERWKTRPLYRCHPSELKFLVGQQSDVTRWLKFLEEHEFYGRISVQPISQGWPPAPQATQVAMDAALKFGWRLSIQQHKYINVK